MKPEFSLNYGEKKYVFEAKNGAVYELEKGITVSVKAKTFSEFDAVEWVLCFENKNTENSNVISNICDCDTLLPFSMPPLPKSGHRPVEGDPCVITMNGCVNGDYYWENDTVSAREFGFMREYLKSKNAVKRFSNFGARSSDGTMPFFDVTVNGEGYMVAVGWSGDWKTEFAKNEEGIRVKTGLKNTGFYLEPGEALRTSSVVLMAYDKNEDKQNKFRRLIKNHFSHISNTKATKTGLMAFELWGGLHSDKMINRINRLKEYDIKFEQIWLDAGWYGKSEKSEDAFTGNWPEHTGDWEINPYAHPGKLKDVQKAIEDAGMNLMLWFEPERAFNTSQIIKDHPNWFLGFQNNKTHKILNYGIKEAREYVYNLISDYIKEYNITCYRQDFNTELNGFFAENDPENRRGITEIKHIMGMYEIWDRLLEEHPGLLIDNCASGGRRIDIETLKRSIPFFRSDYQCNFNENPEVLQAHNANISCYLPYNGCTSKTKKDNYAIRSSFSSSWGGAFYSAFFQDMSHEDMLWAKKITDEYRKTREYFSCDFYNLGSAVFDSTGWAVWQYHNPETNSGIVMAFRRENSPFERADIELKGLNEKAYIFTNLDTGEKKKTLSKISIILAEKRSSVIFEYKQK